MGVAAEARGAKTRAMRLSKTEKNIGFGINIQRVTDIDLCVFLFNLNHKKMCCKKLSSIFYDIEQKLLNMHKEKHK